jgi:hypothetical protein
MGFPWFVGGVSFARNTGHDTKAHSPILPTRFCCCSHELHFFNDLKMTVNGWLLNWIKSGILNSPKFSKIEQPDELLASQPLKLWSNGKY